MPEYPIRDSILSSMTAQEPWPENVKLFQPYEVEQILLPDNASCLAVQAFLKMCNLPFEVEMRWNAEFMSPSGRVPFIKCGAFVVSELEPIAQFAANKGVSLCAKLSTEEKAEMRAYMSLITNVLVNAELYISWIDNDTFNQVTKVRNSSVYPWPLGWLQTRAKRNNVAKRLKALHWHDKTLDQVLADVEQCCNSLSQRLGDKDYFFGTPTPLDALIYGHIRALLSAHGPKSALMLRPITTSLLRLVVRMTSVTGMKLTSQEEYLLHEAFLPRRRGSPVSVSERSRRSQFSVRKPSLDNVINSGFGKPFANKKLIIMTSKRGSITCKYDDRGRFAHYTFADEDQYSCIMEVLEDIMDKVEETAIHGLHFNAEDDNDRNDFEVLAFPKKNILKKDMFDESLEMGDVTDMISIEEVTDELEDLSVIHTSTATVIEEDGLDKDLDTEDISEAEVVLVDSDGMVNDKHLDPENTDFHTPELTDSSNYNTREDGLSTLNSCELSNKALSSETSSKSNTSVQSRFSSESTLKMLSNEEISVESLLNYLRKRNATYHISNMPEVADVD